MPQAKTREEDKLAALREQRARKVGYEKTACPKCGRIKTYYADVAPDGTRGFAICEACGYSSQLKQRGYVPQERREPKGYVPQRRREPKGNLGVSMQNYHSSKREAGICKWCDEPVVLKEDGSPSAFCEEHLAKIRQITKDRQSKRRTKETDEPADGDCTTDSSKRQFATASRSG